LAAAPFKRRPRRALRGLRRFRRLPQPPAREPFHHHVGVLPPQLIEGGQELFALAGAKGRRLLVDQNGPVRVPWRHFLYSGTSRSRRLRRGWRKLPCQWRYRIEVIAYSEMPDIIWRAF